MKTIKLLPLFAVFFMSGCKTPKVPSDYQAFLAYQQQMQKNEQTPKWETSQPKQQKREVDECILLANSQQENLRAYGEGVSFREGIALESAEMDAAVRMAQQIRTAIMGARDRFRGSAAKNLSMADEERLKSLVKQFVEGTISYRIIKTSLYDLSDGTIRCYVCIEQNVSKQDMTKKLVNALSDNEVLQIDFNRDEFANSVKEELDKYVQEQRSLRE